MPETQWHYGFYAVLGLCTVLAVGMPVYLFRNKMI
jgi:Mg2+ and Co2+ transporter CorA